MSKFARKPPPPDFEVIESTLNELDQELRVGTAERLQGNKGSSATWPVVQISNQRTRYVHDMYYRYHRISEETFEYCRKYKIIDAALSDKWLEPGYERLCCLAAIQTVNHTFGTVAVCRLPNAKAKVGKVENPYSGCHGCASGKGGERNIFGNKFGVNLAEEQIKRESGEGEGDNLGVAETPEEKTMKEKNNGDGEDDDERRRAREDEKERKRAKKERKRAKKEKKEKKKKESLKRRERDGDEAASHSSSGSSSSGASKNNNEAKETRKRLAGDVEKGDEEPKRGRQSSSSTREDEDGASRTGGNEVEQ